MFGDGALTFREFIMREPHPLAVIHDAILFEFLPGRDDAVLCGCHAVNAYIDDPRMTQDVDILSPRAEAMTEELRGFLKQQFRMRLRTEIVQECTEYRIDQVRKPKNRHLVDVRRANPLPPNQRVKKVRVLTPPELIASKVITMARYKRSSKRFLHWADLARLLLRFPKLKTEEGPVAERLRAAGAADEVFAAWKALVAEDIQPEGEDDKFLR